MQEEWRIFPSEPDILVSSLGRVMILPKVGKMPHGGVRHYGTMPTYGVVGDGGRMQVFYRGKTYRVHKMVALAFHGERPFDGAVIIHIDEDNKNNSADNIKWGTQKENMNAPGYLNYCRSRTGENSPVVKGRNKAGI